MFALILPACVLQTPSLNSTFKEVSGQKRHSDDVKERLMMSSSNLIRRICTWRGLQEVQPRPPFRGANMRAEGTPISGPARLRQDELVGPALVQQPVDHLLPRPLSQFFRQPKGGQQTGPLEALRRWWGGPENSLHTTALCGVGRGSGHGSF